MKTSILVACFLTAIATRAAGADETSGSPLCADCHGVDGISTERGIPHLNGQLLPYLESSMEKFKTSGRPRGSAKHVPNGVDNAQMTEILKGYSTSKAVRQKSPKIDPALVAKGDSIYLNRCASCHPDNGRDSDKDAPLVAAQDLDYMITQTGYFVDGKRKYTFKMDDAFRGLTGVELTAVAHFFANQDQETPKKKKRR